MTYELFCESVRTKSNLEFSRFNFNMSILKLELASEPYMEYTMYTKVPGWEDKENTTNTSPSFMMKLKNIAVRIYESIETLVRWLVRFFKHPIETYVAATRKIMSKHPEYKDVVINEWYDLSIYHPLDKYFEDQTSNKNASFTQISIRKAIDQISDIKSSINYIDKLKEELSYAISNNMSNTNSKTYQELIDKMGKFNSILMMYKHNIDTCLQVSNDLNKNIMNKLIGKATDAISFK